MTTTNEENMSSEAFSESSAQDTRLAAEEAREWIEVCVEYIAGL